MELEKRIINLLLEEGESLFIGEITFCLGERKCTIVQTIARLIEQKKVVKLKSTKTNGYRAKYGINRFYRQLLCT